MAPVIIFSSAAENRRSCLLLFSTPAAATRRRARDLNDTRCILVASPTTMLVATSIGWLQVLLRATRRSSAQPPFAADDSGSQRPTPLKPGVSSAREFGDWRRRRRRPRSHNSWLTTLHEPGEPGGDQRRRLGNAIAKRRGSKERRGKQGG